MIKTQENIPANKKWRITTSCTLTTEYIEHGFKDLQQLYDEFDYSTCSENCNCCNEIDYANESIDKVEASEDGGKTWKEVL